MAKKQLTATSSPVERRTANEQLAKAQQEYSEALDALKNDQGIAVVPSTGKPLTAQQQINLASNIAAKYDYVDYGSNVGSLESGINVGGDQFFVKGLGNNTQTTFSPEAKTTVNADDGFPRTNTTVQATTPNTNPGVNPNQANTDQGVASEISPQTAIQSQQVQPAIKDSNSTGTKDSTEVGAAIEKAQKDQSTQTQTGVVSNNKNELPATNNRPGRLSDEFSPDNNVTKLSNVDDAAKKSSPMGTAITGFGDSNLVNSSPDPARASPGNQVSIDTTNNVKMPANTPGTNNKAGITERPNVLHNYANWTYNLSWYMLPLGTYNGIIKSGNVPGNLDNLIARSGGVGADLDKAMAGDVYFRNLRFTSVIGNRQSSAATNNFELEMTIVEPYGASLIGELAAMAVNLTGQQSISPAEVPYLLEIDFAGYQDNGDMVESILGKQSGGKKYIPVRILSIEMSLQSAGAVYVMSMAPYSYFAQTPRYAETEFGVTLAGNTVIELLGLQGGLMQYLNGFESLKVTQGLIKIPDEYNIDMFSFTANGSSDQAMASSPLAFPQTGGDSTIMKTRPPTSNDPRTSTYTVTKGSIIKDVIKNVVLHSQYFNEKIKPQTPNDKSVPAELIKIIPVIEITNKYDSSRNEFAKKITFKVFNTLQFGEIYPYVGNAPVSDWGYSKVYNWLFTGKNADVIEANMSFNMVYYAKMQTNVIDYNTIKFGQVATSQRAPSDLASVSRLGMGVKSGSVSTSGSNVPQRYINATMAAEWFDSKMNSSNADNVALDIKIIGDPDWIPQDSSLRGGPIIVGNDLVDRHQSIAIDVAGVYVKLNLRTPRDYNSKTGLMDITNDQLVVQGVYQVITVESNFDDGRFTQTLNMVKVPNQEEEKPNKNTTGTNAAREANSPASVISQPASTRIDPQAITGLFGR